MRLNDLLQQRRRDLGIKIEDLPALALAEGYTMSQSTWEHWLYTKKPPSRPGAAAMRMMSEVLGLPLRAVREAADESAGLPPIETLDDGTRAVMFEVEGRPAHHKKLALEVLRATFAAIDAGQVADVDEKHAATGE